MKSRGDRKVWRWHIIDQPGEYFRIAGDRLYEDNADLENEWRILGETPSGDGLVCEYVSTRYAG